MHFARSAQALWMLAFDNASIDLLHDLLQNSPRRLGCSRWGFRASDCSGVLYRPLEGVSGLEPVSSVAEAVASVILPRKQPR